MRSLAKVFAAILITGAVGLIAGSSALAADGDLDGTFGIGGKVTTDFGGGDAAWGVAVQADGKIVAAGNTFSQFALARYNADGSLDASFGTGGKVTTDFGGAFDTAFAVAIQADGKIVAAGWASGGSFPVSDFALARYNADGSLDASFGSGGKVTTDIAGSGDQASDVAIQPDGRIVAAGTSDGRFALARYNPDGSLDGSFGTGGKVTTPVGQSTFGSALLIQVDGKIVAAGTSFMFLPTGVLADFALARYHPDGSPDASFGTGGTVTTDFGGRRDQAVGMALQADGKLVATGHTAPATGGPGDFALARYDLGGSLDPSFDTDGKVTTDFGGEDVATAVAIQADGKIVAAGGGGPGTDFGLARYGTDGSPDASFGTGGKVTTEFGGFDRVLDLALQPDGRIVAAGVARDDDFALARYVGTQAEVPSTCGEVRGDGRLATNSHTRFVFYNVRSDGTSAPTGQISFSDRSASPRLHFDSTAIASLVIAGSHVTLSGTGTANDVTVDFVVEGDDASPDAFSIRLSNGYSASGSVSNGRGVNLKPC